MLKLTREAGDRGDKPGMGCLGRKLTLSPVRKNCATLDPLQFLTRK